MEKKVKIQIAFYIIAVLSVLTFITGIALPEYIGGASVSYISAEYGVPNISTMLIVGSFCVWTWLSIIGLIFIPKNWIVVLISLVLLLPNVLLLGLSYEFSYSLYHIAKMYVFILSFGLIVI